MKSPLAAILLLTICIPCFADPVAEKLQDATVMLTDGQGHGSGILFTRDGTTFIWTAAHVGEIWVNDDGSYGEVTVLQGNKVGKARILRCGDYSQGADVCLLELTEGDMQGPEIEFYAPFEHIKLGQEILHCGTPLDKLNMQLVSYGNVSYVGRDFCQPGLVDVPRNLDNIDITGYPGCSGGPVIDRETGGIVGLLVMGSAPRLAIMEPTRSIYQWALAHDCLWAFNRTVPMPDNRIQWVSDRYRRLQEEALKRAWDEVLGHQELPAVPPTLEELILDIVEDLLPNREDTPPGFVPPLVDHANPLGDGGGLTSNNMPPPYSLYQ